MKHKIDCKCASCLSVKGMYGGKDNPNWRGGVSKFYCIDCKKLLTNYHVKRCMSCHSVYKKGSNNHNWNGGRPLCNNCGKQLYNYKSKFCIKCRYLVMIGDKHQCWKGGISTLPYSFKFNKYLKEKIRNRDSNICQNSDCNMTNEDHLNKYQQNLQIHHIDYNKFNCKDNNLITLCRKCNSVANFSRDYWFSYFSYKLEIFYEKMYTSLCG